MMRTLLLCSALLLPALSFAAGGIEHVGIGGGAVVTPETITLALPDLGTVPVRGPRSAEWQAAQGARKVLLLDRTPEGLLRVLGNEPGSTPALLLRRADVTIVAVGSIEPATKLEAAALRMGEALDEQELSDEGGFLVQQIYLTALVLQSPQRGTLSSADFDRLTGASSPLVGEWSTLEGASPMLAQELRAQLAAMAAGR